MLKLKKKFVFTPLLFGLLLSLGTEVAGMDLIGPDLMSQPTYSSSKKYTCFFCNERRDYAPALHKHIQLKHPEHTVAECEFCLKLFKDASSCLEHVVQEHGDTLYACVYCPLKLSKKDELIKHVRDDHKNIKTYVCDSCDQSYIRHADVHSHMQNCGSQDDLKFVESLGLHGDMALSQDFLFPQGPDAFFNSLLTDGNVDSLVVDKSTTTASTLATTQPTEQLLAEDEVNQLMHSVMSDINSLNDCLEQYRFVCSVGACTKSFPEKLGLKSHLRHGHSGIETHLCECMLDCVKNTTSEVVMLKHKITEHKKAFLEVELLRLSSKLASLLKSKYDAEWLSERYFCDVEGCEKSYAGKGGLNKHKKARHRPRFVCGFEGCDERYSSEWALETHKLDTHKKDEHVYSDSTSNTADGTEFCHFVCEVDGCPKSFKKKGGLRNHLQNDHGPLQAYLCSCEYNCSKNTVSEELMLKHQINEHKKDIYEDELLGFSKRLKELLGSEQDADSVSMRYFCNVQGCKKSYFQEQYYNIAERGKDFVCNACNKRLPAPSLRQKLYQSLADANNTTSVADERTGQVNHEVVVIDDAQEANEESAIQWRKVEIEDGQIRYECRCGKQYKANSLWLKKHIANCKK